MGAQHTREEHVYIYTLSLLVVDGACIVDVVVVLCEPFTVYMHMCY